MIFGRETAATDSAFAVLADADRRRILRYLQDSDDGVATYDELVFAIAVDEYQHEGRREREKSHVRLLLENRHLPILAHHGVVECDERSETVRYHAEENVEELLSFLSTLE